jgi:hypothetical protein
MAINWRAQRFSAKTIIAEKAFYDKSAESLEASLTAG